MGIRVRVLLPKNQLKYTQKYLKSTPKRSPKRPLTVPQMTPTSPEKVENLVFMLFLL